MIIRSFCIWFAVSVVWLLLTSSVFSRSNAHTDRLAEIEKNIDQIKNASQEVETRQFELRKQREELTKQIETENKNGENAKRRLKISE